MDFYELNKKFNRFFYRDVKGKKFWMMKLHVLSFNLKTIRSPTQNLHFRLRKHGPLHFPIASAANSFEVKLHVRFSYISRLSALLCLLSTSAQILDTRETFLNLSSSTKYILPTF